MKITDQRLEVGKLECTSKIPDSQERSFTLSHGLSQWKSNISHCVRSLSPRFDEFRECHRQLCIDVAGRSSERFFAHMQHDAVLS